MYQIFRIVAEDAAAAQLYWIGYVVVHGFVLFFADQSTQRTVFERFVHVKALFNARLKVAYVFFVQTPVGGEWTADEALICHVYLVADQNERKRGRVDGLRLFKKIGMPYLEIVEGTRVSHVVAEDADVSATVKGHSQRLKAFLASLKLKILIYF